MRLLTRNFRTFFIAVSVAVSHPQLGANAQAGSVVRTAAISGPVSSAFMYWPDIHGDRVVFTSEGDLWLGSITDGAAERLTSHPGQEGRPHFSPDGTQIAFNGQYDGYADVYVMPTAGGSPVRLTYDAYYPQVIGWSPDGKNVLYKSSRRSNIGTNSLFAVRAGGGAPVALPIPQVEQASMNADGKRVAYVPVSADWQHWYRYRGGEADHLWLADTAAHTFKRLGDFDGIDKDPVWVGETVYFISQRDGVPNLWRMDPGTGKAAAVSHYRVSSYGDATKSSFTDYEIDHLSTDGKRLIFEHGQGLALYDPADGKTRELRFRLASDHIHARPRRVPVDTWITGAAIGPTGKRVAVTARGQLISAPVKEGDFRQIAPLPGSRIKSAAWSPDGSQIGFVCDQSGEEEIWVAPTGATRAASPADKPRQLTHRKQTGPLGRLEWSPDGAYLAVGDTEMRIQVIDAKTGDITTVDQSDRGGSYDAANDDYHFSPDGKWLVYAKSEPNWNSAVFLYEIATKRRFRATDDEINAYAPAFSTDGKYLVYLADREFGDPKGSGGSHYFTFDKITRVTVLTLAKKTKSPYLLTDDEEGAAPAADAAKPTDAAKPADAVKPTQAAKDAAPATVASAAPKLPEVVVDEDGLTQRFLNVPLDAGHYSRVALVGDRLIALDAQRGDNTGELVTLQLKKPVPGLPAGPKILVLRGVTDFRLSLDSKHLLIQSGPSLSVVDAESDSVAPASQVSFAGQTLLVDPQSEWRQIFNESWRIARDFYYDPAMQGIDWPAVRQKYAALLPAVADRSDLNEILGQMIAELNTGHAYVGGGDYGDSPLRSAPMGFLGADLSVAEGGTTPAYRIDRIFGGDGFDLGARSPLLEPGVDVGVGEYILAVGGQAVRTNQDIQALFVGTPGQIVTLTVNSKPSLDGARTVQVRPNDGGAEGRMRYLAWAGDRRAYVAKYGGADLGYVHIPSMEGSGLTEFSKHYYANLNKAGIVYDVRYNGGGYIDAMLLLQMSSKPYSYFQPRYGASWTRQDWAFPGYGVALCNEESGSDAEEFSDAFQRLKVGPVIGKRTWGGEVGSGGGYALLDGGSINIPNYGEWTPDSGWVIEGHGVRPDMEVEQDPSAIMAGRDPQLDRAIAYLKEQIAKKPVTPPTHPPFPKNGFAPVSAGSPAPAAGKG